MLQGSLSIVMVILITSVSVSPFKCLFMLYIKLFLSLEFQMSLEYSSP